MESLEQFAIFLKQYGAYAMASVFMILYALERRERRMTQRKYEDYLVARPEQMREFADVQSQAVENLERAFLKSGIDTDPEPEFLDEDDETDD